MHYYGSQMGKLFGFHGTLTAFQESLDSLCCGSYEQLCVASRFLFKSRSKLPAAFICFSSAVW